MKCPLSIFIALALLTTNGLTSVAGSGVEFDCTSVSGIPLAECQALVSFYNSTNGPSWSNHTNWLVTNSIYNWYGLHVNMLTEHVDFVNLSGNRLSGSIPSEFGNLTQLQYLFLDGNQLHGNIPPELGNLTQLKGLILASNQLSGSIPPELGNLTQLSYLISENNQLNGNIPPELGNLTQMGYLALANNQLSGDIPPELGNLTQLYGLILLGNQLSGTIPPELGNLTKLKYIYLADNQLTGGIPPAFGNLALLQELNLSKNQLSGNIPAQLGNLTNLNCLNLSSNHLEGDIPVEFINLVSLSDPGNVSQCGLNLDYNWLNIPAGYPVSGNSFHAFLSQKDPDWHLHQAFAEPLNISGGLLKSLDGKTEIDVPSGILEGETYFSYIPQAAPQHGTGKLVFTDNSFQIQVQDEGGNSITSLTQPVQLTIAYSDDQIFGVDEDLLNLYYWDETGQKWQDAVNTCSGGIYSRNPTGNTFTVPVCYFGEFAVLGQSSFVYLPSLQR